jgi:hypothetical protein
MIGALGRWRVLGRFSFTRNGVEVPISDLLTNQQLDGITAVGVVSTLLGQSGLHSQCLWYFSQKYDWFWAQITEVEKIEYRTDQRFRGG